MESNFHDENSIILVKMFLKWPFFTETGKIGSGKDPKSRFFPTGLKVNLMDVLSTKTSPTLPVYVKNGHIFGQI